MENVLAAIRSYNRKCDRQQRKGLLKRKRSSRVKCYVCTRFMNFRIGNIRFRKGCYVTHDPEQQKVIEGHRYYGRHIFCFDVEPLKLSRIIREGDEGTPSREFFEERQGKEEAEKGREEFPGSIFRQEPTGLVFQG